MGTDSEQAAKLRGVAPHDFKRWGHLRAATDGRPRLVRLQDLPEAATTLPDQLALPAAARLVLDRLGGAELFELNRDGDARRVDGAYRFPKDGTCGRWIDGAEGFDGFGGCAPDTAFHGASGAWEFLRLAWCSGGARLGLFVDAERLAVLESVVVAALPELFELAKSRPVGAAVPPLTIDSTWGVDLTDAQRAELLYYTDARRAADRFLRVEDLLGEPPRVSRRPVGLSQTVAA